MRKREAEVRTQNGVTSPSYEYCGARGCSVVHRCGSRTRVHSEMVLCMSLCLRGSRDTGEEAIGKTPDQMPHTQLQKSRPAKWRRPQRQARARGHDSAGERMAPRMMTEYCAIAGTLGSRRRQVGRADGLAPVAIAR